MDNPTEYIERLEYSPSSDCNLLQFSILPIRVRIVWRKGFAGAPARVFIRTNLNQARRIRRQIIDRVERQQSYSTDFYDIPAVYDAASGHYLADVLLSEVGYFEFKVRIDSARRQEPWTLWAEGPNVGISVRPWEYGRNNSIYCAFLRQYVPEKHRDHLRDPDLERQIQHLEDRGAYVVPPSGNFEQFKEVLPFIVQELGMKIIHLLPINPVPVSYGRMGMYGSPYATNDYFGIDPIYATFSRDKTIEEQFIDLTSSIHGLGAKVFLDMVINHAGWAASIHFTHPHWHKKDKEGRIISPGAWGVVWGDLVELDYRHRDLWQYMAGMFLSWCQRGIDGFRLDAGYKVPREVWQYLISKVRDQYPDTLFLLEGLGGPWKTTEDLLTRGQMNWAYSELFQNYSRRQIVDYLEYAQRVSAGKGVLVHYAETHDNERLAKKGKTHARMRLYLSALTSFSGAWGFANGVEWLATERIDVHRNTALHWGNGDNLIEDIARLNRILAENPAFWECDGLEMADVGEEEILAFTRRSRRRDNILLCLINLNAEQAKSFAWNLADGWLRDHCRPGDRMFLDLLTGQALELPADHRLAGRLSPGGCLLYRLQDRQLAYQVQIPALYAHSGNRIALIYEILLDRFAGHEAGRIDQEALLGQVEDFRRFIALTRTVNLAGLMGESVGTLLERMDPGQVDRFSRVWTFHERNKEFMLSGDQWLVARTYLACTAYLQTDRRTIRRDSLAHPDGIHHEVYFPPLPEGRRAWLKFNWKVKRQRIVERHWQEESYPIHCLPRPGSPTRPAGRYPLHLEKNELGSRYATILLTNGIGGVCQAAAMPGWLTSKYEALLSVSDEPGNPAARIKLVKTVRETVRIGAKFFDLDDSFLVRLTRYPHPVWEFLYDDGDNFIRLERTWIMPAGHHTLYIRYKLLESARPIELICKAYLEWRPLHETLRAAESVRRQYEESCRPLEDRPGMAFSPQPPAKLILAATQGEFVRQPHWMYDIDFPQEAEQGLPHTADAFCPGFFRAHLARGENQVLQLSAAAEPPARISAPRAATEENRRAKQLVSSVKVEAARRDPLVKVLVRALDQFLVRTDQGWQMLAGFPWLGMRLRDVLACVPGLLAAGRWQESRDVILQAARTERDGLLADFLTGGPIAATGVEAALRLFEAAYQYVRITGAESFWDSLLGDGRSVRQVLVEIFDCLRRTDGDGIRLDEDSGLLYCPPGFTWMNTDHPRATPREGYPVEVQAFWYQALRRMPQIYPPQAPIARQLSGRIQEQFGRRFWCPKRGYLADRLVASGAEPAEKAAPDHSLRCNQLWAVTQGLVSPDQGRQVLAAVFGHLLIPGAVRSLSEGHVPVPLKVVDRRGVELLNPRRPYQGRCQGDETQRRLAYHNGTAWPCVYPVFVEALAAVDAFWPDEIQKALAFFEPLYGDLARGAIGTLAEMKDGNYPHARRGCFAYALSVAEVLRVYLLLKYRYPEDDSA